MGSLPVISFRPGEAVAAAEDFGHMVHRVPVAVAHPRDAEEVAALVQHARQEELPVRARGSAHSVRGKAQCEGGIICDLSALDQIHEMRQEWVSLGAGARWNSVLSVRRGLTPPVLTDYLDLTVGGTLSAGGIGGASYRHGPQADNVLDLDVVTPSGEIVTCSASVRADIFFGALCGQGDAGIITRATIPLLAAPARVRWYKIPAPDLGTLITWQRHLARNREPGYLEGQIIADENGQWTFILEVCSFSSEPPLDAALLGELAAEPGSAQVEDTSYLSFCDRMQARVRMLAMTGDWFKPHPWLSVFLPSDAAEQYAAQALASLTLDAVGPIPILLYPLRRGEVPAPRFPTPAADADGLFYSFTILRTIPDDPAAITAALDHNQLLASTAVDAGGTIYPISALSQHAPAAHAGQPR